MKDLPVGIQSYCFREFKDIPSLIGALKTVSLPYVEIFPGHIDYRGDRLKTDESFASIRDAGISVTAYGGVSLKNDLADARRLCEFARRNGIRYLTVVRVEDEALPMLEELAREYGVLFCIHNHGRGFQFGTFEECRSIFARTGKAFGLCNDTAWFLDSGEDPVRAVEMFADRLYGVHLKDFRFDAGGKPVDVIIGEGGLDLRRLVQTLDRVGFSGYVSLEYEGNPQDPMPDVLRCLAAVRRAVGGS